MNNKNFSISSKDLMMIIMYGIGFITYNVLLFTICGFNDHGGSFWTSYVFMIVAFITLGVCALVLKSSNLQPKDWFMGYPIIRHGIVYMIAELICSILFVALDYAKCPWAVALVVQLLLFAVFAVLIISAFFAKETIEDVQTKVKTRTSKIKLLHVDAQMIAESSSDMAVKQAFVNLAEAIRYSDPTGCDEISDLEEQIEYVIGQAKTSVSMNDVDSALALCQKANLLLEERNRKCMIFK